MTAWAADRVPYERRAGVIGFVELSWAGAMLAVVPAAGVVIAVAGWRWAYGLLALAAAAMAVAVRRRVADTPATGRPERERVRFRLSAPVVAGLAGFALLMAASNAGFVVFGAWLGDAYGYEPATIGLASVVLGVAELAATAMTMRITDRIGKRTAVVAGAALMVPAGATLGLAGERAWVGLPLFAVFVLGFEFALVSALPLISELQADARAAGLGLAIGFGTVARGVVSIATTRLYDAHGVGGSGALGAACAASVVAVYGIGLRGHIRLR